MSKTAGLLLVLASVTFTPLFVGCGGAQAPQPACVPACAMPTPVCDIATHACVACRVDADCAAGTICGMKDGAAACVMGCKDDSDCAAQGQTGFTCCSRGCVDIRSDASHCGACATACPVVAHGAAACTAGVCGIGPCEAGWTNCDGDAKNGCEVQLASDPQHCGACMTSCGAVPNATPGCKAGACGIDRCAGAFADCDKRLDDGCEVDTSSDDLNCGACGTVCGALPHAASACRTGACAITACDAGFGNCDQMVANGCEVTLTTDLNNCGICGEVCKALPNSVASCVAGQCGLGACAQGFGNCNGVLNDGCEAALASDTGNCGACGRACPLVPNGLGACTNGGCTIMSCDAGFADCDGQVANGCEVKLGSDAANCGACGKVCPAVANGMALCAAGKCGAACIVGFADCNQMPQDGCETDLTSDVGSCGGCGKGCPMVANGSPGCRNSTCGVASCAGGWGNCDGMAGNGCEQSLAGDPLNCGACGKTCGAVPNGNAACQNAACVIGSCSPGFRDCNGLAADGCETAVLSDARNCGACGTICPGAPNASPTCSNGGCSISCANGWADCDLMSGNGCEVLPASDPSNCGSCGKVCSLANATAGCGGGQCVVASCNAGWANCDNVAANGCERPTVADPTNCGGCGKVCAAVANGVAGCAMSTCLIASCNGNFADCDGNYGNGCEVNRAGDANNCGACGKVCPAVANGAPGCAAGNCGVGSCNGGFADCDGSAQNGCELPTSADVNNCGACNKVCAAVANASPTCGGGVCGAACNMGFGNCDGQLGNGCEVNLLTATANCGSCGKVCTFANGVAGCANGGCILAACNANYASCDGVDANGCEVFTSTDKNNCGGCGVVCGANQTCVAGVCKNGIKVLLVTADTAAYVTDLKTKLLATGAFNAVDTFDAIAATPTVLQLQAYDSVLVWSDNTFLSSATLGDNLATYYDNGGNVVVAMFSLQSAGYGLAGRFGTVGNGYILLTPGGYSSTAASLGAVAEPQSPLMTGVVTLSAVSGFRDTGGIANGGIRVASWNDGTPLVVRGVVKGRNRVDINMWPTSNTAYNGAWIGDGATLLKNALLYR